LIDKRQHLSVTDVYLMHMGLMMLGRLKYKQLSH